MKTGGKIVMSLVVVGAAGFFMWKYLKKRQTKKIAECIAEKMPNMDITLEHLIEVLPTLKDKMKGGELKTFNECENNNKLLG
tara:strand:+ start:2204 stop:2449 length:246 start_codon:yes stop_codon:yes gene_type:complete